MGRLYAHQKPPGPERIDRSMRRHCGVGHGLDDPQSRRRIISDVNLLLPATPVGTRGYRKIQFTY
jgi:hypothetical protein